MAKRLGHRRPARQIRSTAPVVGRVCHKGKENSSQVTALSTGWTVPVGISKTGNNGWSPAASDKTARLWEIRAAGEITFKNPERTITFATTMNAVDIYPPGSATTASGWSRRRGWTGVAHLWDTAHRQGMSAHSGDMPRGTLLLRQALSNDSSLSRHGGGGEATTLNRSLMGNLASGQGTFATQGRKVRARSRSFLRFPRLAPLCVICSKGGNKVVSRVAIGRFGEEQYLARTAWAAWSCADASADGSLGKRCLPPETDRLAVPLADTPGRGRWQGGQRHGGLSRRAVETRLLRQRKKDHT